MQQFFYTPFANAGDKTAIPVPSQISGDVSFSDGYTADYAQDPGVDPLTAKDIERQKFNQLMFAVTTALKELQSHAIPDFITSSLNGGSPWSYSKDDLVRWNNGVETLAYISLVNSNTSDPSDTTKWRRFSASSFPTGSLLAYDGSTLPADNTWIWADGKTVGNASSNATNRANADTYDLFVLTWNSYSNTLRPIINSNGTAGTRGASADADWNANKAITIRDMRGNVAVGRDDMGGTAANRITTGGCGISGVTLGASGGEQTHALTSNENASHTHGPGSLSASSAGAHTHTMATNTGAGSGSPPALPIVGVSTGSSTTPSTNSAGAHTHTITGSTDNSGTGQAHNNVQPSGIVNYLLKL